MKLQLPISSRHTPRLLSACGLAVMLLMGPQGCKKSAPEADSAAARPTIVTSGDPNVVKVSAPERFPLTSVAVRSGVDQLNVTGSVNPDISREIPVLSLANGRVVALHVGLGDTVSKGQLIMEVQSADVSTAFGTYLKAVSDEHLATATLDRDTLLFDKGAISQSTLQAAQNAEDDAKSDLTASEEQLHILGVDKRHPGENVKVYAPASGIVISQNVTASGAAGVTYAGPAGSLTIADLSHVWVICDVYENDLAKVHLGQHADIRLNAFPDKVFAGVISDIGTVLDTTIRTAKVRIQVQNSTGQLRLGMFATATISGSSMQQQMAVPSSSLLQLHDLAYVFVPGAQPGDFRRVLVKPGQTLAGGAVQILSGLNAGQQVVTNALDLQNTADQQ